MAAYTPGWPLHEDKLDHIPICEQPGQTGCVTGWTAWRDGTIPKNYDQWYGGATSVNPITWRRDTLPNEPEDHTVFVGRKFDELVERPLTARVKGSILWVSKPFAVLPTKNLHVGDFNLFWVNVRENAVLRAKTFQAQAKR